MMYATIGWPADLEKKREFRLSQAAQPLIVSTNFDTFWGFYE
jgi:hypothetical protein